MAAVHLGETYDRKLVHGLHLSANDLAALREKLVRVPLAERAELPGLGRDRADIAPAAAVMAGETLAYLGASRVIVSDDGLLWGVVAATVGQVQSSADPSQSW